MKGPEHWGLVVRTPEGELWKKSWLGSTWNKKGIWKYPLFRGVASMVEMMRVGMRALNLSAEVALGGGKALRITASGNGPQSPYVQSVRWNGKPWTKNWIGHADLARGGELAFVMGDKPSRFGTAKADRPPSYHPGPRPTRA